MLIFLSHPRIRNEGVQLNSLMFPVESSHLLDNPLTIWHIAAYYFFFTLNFMLNPGIGELFLSDHSQERDKRPLKVVHSIKVIC